MSSGDPILRFRSGTVEDVPTLVGLLADDELGAHRERVEAEHRPKYIAAMHAICADPRNEIVVGVLGDDIVAMAQVTYIPGLSRYASERLQFEGVRVARAYRGSGYGRQLISTVLHRARERGCALAQLTTDKQRTEAHSFYQSLGFVPSHEGLKLTL